MPRLSAVDPASKAHDPISWADKFCRDHGARLTLNRRKVLAILVKENRAMGAYEILKRLQPLGSQWQSITIYRALDFLLRQGLIVRLASSGTFVAIDPRHSQSDIYLTCEHCGKSIRKNNFLVKKLVEQNAGDSSFRIRLEGIELLGTCAKCLSSE
jgi:Fur family zinc uptake transcriptional regulator